MQPAADVSCNLIRPHGFATAGIQFAAKALPFAAVVAGGRFAATKSIVQPQNKLPPVFDTTFRHLQLQWKGVCRRDALALKVAFADANLLRLFQL